MTARSATLEAALAAAIAALAAPGQPTPLYQALERELGRLIGHKLFTLMTLDEPAGLVRRVHSSDQDAYPVGGTKVMGATPWGEHVIRGRQAWVGRTPDDIRWAFFDHELIASLGCGSGMNVPVLHDGRCLGTINMMHEAGWYDRPDAALAAPFAALLVPAFLVHAPGLMA